MSFLTDVKRIFRAYLSNRELEGFQPRPSVAPRRSDPQGIDNLLEILEVTSAAL